MRYIVLIICSLILFESCKKEERLNSDFYSCNLPYIDSSSVHSNHIAYNSLLQSITREGIVGISMSVYTPSKGMWLGASGKADIYNDITMQPCNLSRVGSTVKVVTATTVLKLAEEGKINLDDKISDYLEGEMIDKIENARSVTIRQLLNHSGGLYNYIQNLQFQTASLNDLIKAWRAPELLKYAYNKKAYFKPGEDVRYSNTGYILLGLLIEEIEKKPFYNVFDEKIFKPAGMSSTRFATADPVPDGIVRGYIDIYSNKQVIECTYYSGWDYYTADGGLISNPYDMNLFMQALFDGKLINKSSLDEMMQWKTPKEVDPAFYPIQYGLGIFKIETEKGIAYMHSGDAIGYYANMLYFPADKTSIVYAVNSNYGKLDQYVSTKEAMGTIISVVKEY